MLANSQHGRDRSRPPLALIILDGWGNGAPGPANAIANAHKPTWDRLVHTYSITAIPTSGLDVGLPVGQQGNSEVGHLNMGAGRIVYQEFTRINKAVADGEFFANPVLNRVMDDVKARGTRLHLMGLCSDGGVHSHLDHAEALVKLGKSKGITCLYVHAFTDGRDVSPTSGAGYLRRLEADLARAGLGKVATVSGRYYAMDRDKRWERIEQAWKAMVLGEGEHADDAASAVEASYGRGVTDEFVVPTVIDAEGTLREGDGVIFFNFRPDRAREITRALTDPTFDCFLRPQFPHVSFVCLTQYDATFELPVAFLPQSLARILSPVLADAGLRQLRLAETEKYAHVTFFFNGGVEQPYAHEERVLIPSPKVKTYDQKPEMSAFEVARTAAEWIRQDRADVYVINFANADMVGHTGNYQAAVKAIEALDLCLKEVVGALEARGGTALITADHGNAEQMVDPATGEMSTSHTVNPVPLLLVAPGQRAGLRADGHLSDIAPTMLQLLGLPQPIEMTGHSLLETAVSGANR